MNNPDTSSHQTLPYEGSVLGFVIAKIATLPDAYSRHIATADLVNAVGEAWGDEAELHLRLIRVRGRVEDRAADELVH